MGDAPLFKNAEWSVYEDRMVHHAGYEYSIPARGYAEKRGDSDEWDWVHQLGEKNWFKVREFAEAFIFALNHHGIPVDAGLILSFYKLGRDAAEARVYEIVQRDLGIDPEKGLDVFKDWPRIEEEAARRLGRK